MTTVGYGDFYPRTHLGRFIIVIACFWGVFMVSMMVVTLTENSEFSKGEKRAYEILARLKAKQKATEIAKHIVLASFRFNMVKKLKNSGSAIVGSNRHIRDIEGTYIDRYNKLIGLVQKFSEQREIWKKWELEDGEMLRQLNEKIDVDIEELKNQVASICEVEQQLQRVEKFQASSMEATRISLLHMEELNVQLKKILDNMSSKI
jgi:potassium intermediate/small conductance calcium-activated channel subfamily N protein 2